MKSTVYYFSCLYAEAKTALAAFDELYLPMAEQLKLIVDAETTDNEVYFRLVDADETGKIPKPVLNWVRTNERMLGMFAVLKQIDAEKRKVDGVQSWRASKFGPEVISPPPAAMCACSWARTSRSRAASWAICRCTAGSCSCCSRVLAVLLAAGAARSSLVAADAARALPP